LNRFRVAFATLVLVAAATSLLAGWGLVSSSSFQSGSGASSISTTTSSALSSSTAVSQSSEGSSTQGANSTTNGASESTTTLTETTTTSVTTTTVSGGATFGVAGPGSTTTTQTQAASGGSTGLSIFGLFGSSAPGESLVREVQATSLLLAPVCWIVLGGMWVWRGRVRARYSEMGFGSDVFELFMKMKGGATRIKVLNTLATPKDRLQLAEELGVDWKTVDRHVQILHKYGFVTEQAAYGTVRMYQVTPMGKMLLNLFDDLERTGGPVPQQPQPITPRSQEGPSGS
jgi:hypothetical protein